MIVGQNSDMTGARIKKKNIQHKWNVLFGSRGSCNQSMVQVYLNGWFGFFFSVFLLTWRYSTKNKKYQSQKSHLSRQRSLESSPFFGKFKKKKKVPFGFQTNETNTAMYGHNPNCWIKHLPFEVAERNPVSLCIFRVFRYVSAPTLWLIWKGFLLLEPGRVLTGRDIHKDQWSCSTKGYDFFSLPIPSPRVSKLQIYFPKNLPQTAPFVCLELPRVEVQKMGRCFGREASVKPLCWFCRTILCFFFWGGEAYGIQNVILFEKKSIAGPVLQISFMTSIEIMHHWWHEYFYSDLICPSLWVRFFIK